MSAVEKTCSKRGEIRGRLIEGRCAYYLAKKKRYCRMYATKGGYCVEHSDQVNEETAPRRRIPCPLNPNHSCYEDMLQKHLKKCNSRVKLDKDYMVENINSGETNEETERMLDNFSLDTIPDDVFFGFIDRLKTFFQDGDLFQVQSEVLNHPVLQDELNNTSYGPQVLKHCKQQASLLGHLDKIGALSSNTTFIEFGAGKGQLCHWIQRSLEELNNVRFLLVERSGVRYKKDVFHRSEKDGPVFERLRMDIAHLCLGKHSSVSDPQAGVVAVSKHLCGPATDLALRCFVSTLGMSDNPKNTSQQKRRRAMVMAMCCHHRCTWKEYVGKEFLSSHGFGPREFKMAVALTSWAVCGFRDLLSAKGDLEMVPNAQHNPATDDGVHRCSRFTSSEKEEIGWLCKRLIDVGRVQFLQNAGYKTDLKFYVEKDVSLENLVLIATAE